MRLYLMQHGEALDKELDPERPLSDKGKQDVAAVAALFKAQATALRHVRHSGKLRAEQTAQLMADTIRPGIDIDAQEGLSPNDDVEAFAHLVHSWQEDTLVVGHLPFMAKLAAHLLTGEVTAEMFGFQPGTLLCLERAQSDRWQLNWMVRPELAGRV